MRRKPEEVGVRGPSEIGNGFGVAFLNVNLDSEHKHVFQFILFSVSLTVAMNAASAVDKAFHLKSKH